MTTRMSSAERKEEILDVALKIIHDKGFYNLTLRNIAEKIGISEAAIYRHYDSKKEIVDKLANIVFYENQLWNKKIDNVSPYKMLEKIILNQLKILRGNPYLTSIIFQEGIFSEYPDIREKFNKHREKNEKFISSIVSKGQENGIIDKKIDPAVFALIYMGGLRISVLKWRSSNFSYDIEIEGKKLIKELFRYLKR